jgi:hypothetical protein
MKKNISTALVILVLGSALAAQAPDRLARIDHLFQTFVDEDRLGGAVALVLRDGKPVYEKRSVGPTRKLVGR